MALWKPFRGNHDTLNTMDKHDGYVYFCIDDGSLFFDYTDASGVLQRKQITVQEAEKLLNPIDITIGKKTVSVDGSKDVSFPLYEVMGSIETPSSGNSNKGKWVKFATINLPSAWNVCSGILNFTKTEGSSGAEGILSYYFRNGSSTSTTDISLSWISLNNETWAESVAAVQVSNGKFNLYYKPVNDYETVLITAINIYNPSYLTFGTDNYVSTITSAEVSSIHSYAKSANSAAMLQTYKPGSTTETYGEQYPLMAQWEDENTLRLYSEDSITKVNYAETADKATKDADGNIITSTYATQTALNDKMDKANPTGTGSFSLNRKEGTTVGINSVAVGKDCEVSGNYSFAAGNSNIATGNDSFAAGLRNTVSGLASVAMGAECQSTGTAAIAEGALTIASQQYSHAEGLQTQTTGEASHAEGGYNIASGRYSHAEGYSTEAQGHSSHAEGYHAIASGYHSHAEGYYTTASGNYSHVQGKFNIEDTENKYAHIVGKGQTDGDRSNAHTLDWNGNAWFAGDVFVGGTGQDASTAVKLVKPSDLATYQPKLTAGDNITISGNTISAAKGVDFYETQTIHLGSTISPTTPSYGSGWSYNSSTSTYTHTGTAGTLEFTLPSDAGDLIFVKFNHANASGASFTAEDSVTVAYGDTNFLSIYDGTTSVEMVLKKGTADTVFRINALNDITVNITNLIVYKVLESGGTTKEVRALNVSHNLNMLNSQTGFWNVALGPVALGKNVNGSRNIALGRGSLGDLESGNRNVALGTFALAHATNGDRNIFIGADSGLYLEKANDCVSIGKAALSQGIKRDSDIAIGAGALYGAGDAKTSDASQGNIGIGNNSGYYCYGKSNVFVGKNAGYSTSSGNMNVCIGNEAGKNLKDGWGNTAIGSNAYNVGNYSRSIAIGYNAVPTKSFQAVIGNDQFVNETVLNGDIVIKGNAIKKMPTVKLEYNYTDASNVARSGSTALLKTEDIAKGNNVAIGNEALNEYTLSDDDLGTNVAIGNYAGQNVTGLANVMIGRNAGLCRTGTNNNVMIGSNAGIQRTADKTKTQGHGLTLIGAGSSTADVGYSNSIAIGWNSKVTKSNQAVIGKEDLVETVLYGDLIIVGTDGTRRKIYFGDDGLIGWIPENSASGTQPAAFGGDEEEY